MIGTASFRQDDQFWFRGHPQGPHLSAPDPPESTVYGIGTIPCAGVKAESRSE